MITRRSITLRNTRQVKSYSASYKKGLSVRHVVKHSGGWAVRKSGSKRASRVFDTQSNAILFASRQAKSSKSAIVIHGSDGKIRDIRRY